MKVLEHIKNLTHSLTPKQRAELASYLDATHSTPVKKQPISLRGIWKGKFPDDADLDALLVEIRNEWKDELELYK
jgi:hypothetical protein